MSLGKRAELDTGLGPFVGPIDPDLAESISQGLDDGQFRYVGS